MNDKLNHTSPYYIINDKDEVFLYLKKDFELVCNKTFLKPSEISPFNVPDFIQRYPDEKLILKKGYLRVNSFKGTRRANPNGGIVAYAHETIFFIDDVVYITTDIDDMNMFWYDYCLDKNEVRDYKIEEIFK